MHICENLVSFYLWKMLTFIAITIANKKFPIMRKADQTIEKGEKEFADYKALLEKKIEASENDFEKQLSYISAGALVLSITYMNNLFDQTKVIVCKPALFTGWLLLILTLVLNLISHLLSVNFTNAVYQELITKGTTEVQPRGNRCINLLNWASIVSLVLALILITYFSYKNL